MERSGVTGYIRIAVTTLSLTTCVLLVALWVRSYSWLEGYGNLVGRTRFGADSLLGCIILHYDDITKRSNSLPIGYYCAPASGARLSSDIRGPFFWFRFSRLPSGFSIILPFWFPIALSIGF